MLLHPDRTFGNKASEDELKAVTTAYNLVDQVHREALEFFQKPGPEQDRIAAAARRERENEARARTGKPRHIPPEPAPEDDDTAEPAPSPVPETAAGTIRYFAASVPRYIRNARLFYLSRDAIIGSRLVKNNSGGLVYDIIMLPEPEFMRAKLYLSLAVGQTSSLELTMSKITPAYSPVDTKFLRLPLDEPDPYRRARAYFVAQFGLDQTTSS